MQLVDYIVVVLYALGIIAAGMVFAGKMKNAREMFAAGGRSPWWVSGLSAFMTVFSAGTFVVWGGVAYQYGMVAVAINITYGLAAILVGWFIASAWRRAGVDSASQFLELRFGDSIVQFYTWFKGLLTMFSTGGSVYAIAVIVCALMPLPDGHMLADPDTGHLSVTLTSIALTVMVIVIAFAGGLWAVLMTDVLQFVILTVSVVFVVPLIVLKAGGVGEFVSAAPDGFFLPVAGEFSWWFLVGWLTVNFIQIGGDWAFVQRYVCVPKEKDAKKVAYLIGALYLISPLFWMLPPLIYRTIDAGADPEQAYILACKAVLPAGMVGLMIAAMTSATASMATTRLNVFAGAFTEVYQRWRRGNAAGSDGVLVGRIATICLGAIILTGALLIPGYGYTRFILDINTLLYVPLVMPTVWGLYSRKIGLGAVWVTTVAGFTSAYLIKFGLTGDGFWTDVAFLQPVVEWIAANARIADMLSGIGVPFIVLSAVELLSRTEHTGWQRVQQASRQFSEQEAAVPSMLPIKMVAITLSVIAAGMVILALINHQAMATQLLFAGVLLLIVWGVQKGINRAAEIPT